MSQSVQETQNINYISQLRKIFVGRNNQPVTQRFKIDYRITSKYYFQVINAINQIIELGGKNYELYISKTNTRGQNIILAYQNSFSITDDVLCFNIDTYTEPWLQEIKSTEGVQVQITIVAKDGVSTQVVLRDNALAFPRPYQSGVTPTIFVTQTVYDGTVPVSGSFGAGTDIALSESVNTFGFGTGIRTSTEDQTVIGRYNEMDGSKSFIIANGVAGTENNIFTVDWEGNVEANKLSATALTINGEEFSLSGIDEKFAATSAWANETFETKVDAVSSFNALNLEIQGVTDSLSAYAKTIDVPTKISDLTNDSDFATTGYVQEAIDAATSGTGDLYETKVDATSKYNYLTGKINETNENIYQNYALKSEVPTRVSQLENDEDYASKTYVGEKNQEVLGYVGNNYTTNATFNSSVSNLSGAVSNLNNTLTANYAPISTLPTQISELENDVGYITGVNLDPYALKTELPTKVSELENDVGYVTSSQIEPSRLTNKKTALIDRDVKEYNFRIHYQEDVEVFVNWQDTLSGVLYISPIERFDLEEGKQIEVEQFVKPVGEFTAVSGNGVQIADLPDTFGSDKILVFKRFITNDNGVYKQFAKFEFEYSNEDVEQLIHEPLTFIALEDETKISFDLIPGSAYVASSYTAAIQYAINEGEWQDYTMNTQIDLNQGDEISFQRISGDITNNSSDNYHCKFNSSQGKFNVEGSIGSIYSVNKIAYLFRYLTGLVDASKLQLPNTVGGGSFICLFYGCTSLTGIPKLPATTLANVCYQQMFQGCTSLEYVPEDYLPVMNLAASCYNSMFKGCTSLKNVPRLPATTLAASCYSSMFRGCISLTEVPEDLLIATTLAVGCYQQMFNQCTSLRKAPKLPATTLADACYYTMFWGCNSLNEIDCALTAWTGATNATLNWLEGVAAEGVFKKTTSLPATRGRSNIPSGWIIENEDDLNFIAHGNIQIELKREGSPSAIALKYSTDGETFLDYTIGDVISLSAGQVLSMYNTTNNFSIGQDDYYKFSMSGTGWVEVEGHIDALVNHASGAAWKYRNLFYGCTRIFDASKLNFENDIIYGQCYNQMFRGCTNLLYAPKLPATTMAIQCYSYMFTGCTSLTDAPELPATNLASYCYQQMFDSCTSLTAVPRLPATTIIGQCYYGMFQYCTSLKVVPKDLLPATTLANACYRGMFKGCTRLSTVPEDLLPASTAAQSCYRQMFQNCTSLRNAPKLPAKYVNSFGYEDMFNGCSSLTACPDLPASGIGADTYMGMFRSCTSLTSTPDLPALTLYNSSYQWMFRGCTNLTDTGYIAATGLVSGCCNQMFYGCSKLSSINVGFAEWNDLDNATYQWVEGVAASGIFRKPSTLNRVEGPSNIPQGWEKLDNDCVTFICKEDNVEVALVQVGSPSAISVLYSVNGNDLEPYSVGTVVSLTPGDTVSFKNETQYIGTNASNFYKFTTTGTGFVDVEGNVASLVGMSETSKLLYSTFNSCKRIQDASKLIFPWETLGASSYDGCFQNCTNLTAVPQLRAKNVSSYAYTYMFNNCYSLSSVPEDLLPATTMASKCYNRMFQGCTALRNVPKLPATVMATDCYSQMFQNCTSLSSIPSDLLPATTLAHSCYYNMFYDCTSLTNAPELPATILATNCYYAMFTNCTSLTVAPDLPATILAPKCYYMMFYGCTNLTNAPQLPATELDIECYRGMFTNCTSLGGQINLPATKLATGCCWGTFNGCSRITSIILPAKLLLSNCYNIMLKRCTSLSSVTVGFTQWDSEQDATANWLQYASATGNFYCPSNLDTTTRDESHIPSGWSINPANNRGGVVLNLTKGGLKGLQKGGFEELEEEIEEEIEIPPYQDQERISSFPDDENQDHVTGFIDPLPAPQIEEEEEYVLGDQPETPTPSRDEMR